MSLSRSLVYFIPEIILLVTVLVILSITSVSRKAKRFINLSVVTGLGLALIILLSIRTLPHGIFSNFLVHDNYGQLIKIIAVIIAIIISILYNREQIAATAPGIYISSVFLILILAIFILISANHLIVFFVTLQIINVAGFLIAQSTDTEPNTIQVAWSDLIFSLAAGMTSLFGITIIYGLTGTFFISEIGQKLAAEAHLPSAIIIALVMVFFGFTHTMTAFLRLHWNVKILRTQPIFSRMILSTLPQFGEIAFLIRLINSGFLCHQNSRPLFTLLSIFGVITLCYPILWIFKKQKPIDLLNVTSASQIGFSILAVCSLGNSGYVAAIFFQIVYIGNRLALATGDVLALEKEKLPGQVYSLASLIGIPLTAGFSAKFLIFSSLFKPFPGYYILIVIGLIAFFGMFIGYGRLVREIINNRLTTTVPSLNNKKLIYCIRLILLLLIAVGGIYWLPLTDHIQNAMIFWTP